MKYREPPLLVAVSVEEKEGRGGGKGKRGGEQGGNRSSSLKYADVHIWTILFPANIPKGFTNYSQFSSLAKLPVATVPRCYPALSASRHHPATYAPRPYPSSPRSQALPSSLRSQALPDQIRGIYFTYNPPPPPTPSLLHPGLHIVSTSLTLSLTHLLSESDRLVGNA